MPEGIQTVLWEFTCHGAVIHTIKLHGVNIAVERSRRH